MSEAPAQPGRKRRRARSVMALTAAGMVVALLVDVLVARRLGATRVYDALVVALVLPRLLVNVGREATKFSLVTALVQAKQERGEAAAADLAGRTLVLVVGLGVVIGAGLVAGAGPVARWVGAGLADEPGAIAQATLYLRVLAGMSAVAVVSAVVEVVLNAEERFTLPACRNVLPSAVALGFVAAAYGVKDVEGAAKGGPAALIAWGYTAGFAAYLVVLCVGLARVRPSPVRLGVPTRATLVTLRGAAGLPLAGFGVRQGANVVVRRIASFAPAGELGAFHLAYRLLAALQNIVGVSLAITGQARLTRQTLRGDDAAFDAALRKRVVWIVAGGVPASVAMALLARPVLTVLLAGRFSEGGLDTAVDCLRWLSPALTFYCLTPVLNGALYARRRVGWVFVNMATAATLNVTLGWWLFGRVGMGVQGIALAATVAAVGSVAFLFWILWWTARRPLGEER